MTPEFSLAVQYAAPAPELPRWRLRRWALCAVKHAAHERPEVRSVTLTLRLVDLDEGRELNLAYRNRDYATNVLTFEYGLDPTGSISGDIVLCLPVLEREAAEQGKALLDHAAHLTVHGVLHALGHDHIEADDARDMEALETQILASMGIDDPYA
ncbi:MAG TPA: rRNA maturation RNase YbeY [Pusillimonas sp.]|uniref:rRNA maturation RNase YbeY n=1 Tax=unclassified Pusillimonas TaxID=2640016 RepID=UPI0026028921|nr:MULTISPECIES: rRNA maturation RNase YbeY [unclassified Pusillimonas]HLU20808.1 rRNA maturation RNase YbeY [Pusillimonas sp.]